MLGLRGFRGKFVQSLDVADAARAQRLSDGQHCRDKEVLVPILRSQDQDNGVWTAYISHLELRTALGALLYEH